MSPESKVARGAWFCTSRSSPPPPLHRFDICVIDEAAQALEPACWIAMLKARK